MLGRQVRGFTLVEVLVVTVIIGILASIAINRVQAKKLAYVAVMKSDLRTMVNLQEMYYDTHRKYASGVNQLGWSPTVEVQEIVVGVQGGWTARARHPKLPGYQCAVYVGDVTPIFFPATREGIPACDDGSGTMGGGGPP